MNSGPLCRRVVGGGGEERFIAVVSAGFRPVQTVGIRSENDVRRIVVDGGKMKIFARLKKNANPVIRKIFRGKSQPTNRGRGRGEIIIKN